MWSPTGAVLIPYLFHAYADDLIIQQRQRGYGLRKTAGQLFIGWADYADDIALLPASYRVGRRSRRTFSTDFEIFRRRVDDVVSYFFFNSDFKFFDDASEFSVTSLYVVFILSSKVMLIFLLYN